MSFERFCQPACFFAAPFTVETAQNSREECNEFTDLLCFRLSLCLSRDSLSCDTRSLDLCILFKFTAISRKVVGKSARDNQTVVLSVLQRNLKEWHERP